MSGINETNKIVDLQQRQANQSGAPDRVGELLKLVRATALKRINGLVTNLFENIDDALFDLAEKAENNSVQTGYFNGMRCPQTRLCRCRKRRSIRARCRRYRRFQRQEHSARPARSRRSRRRKRRRRGCRTGG